MAGEPQTPLERWRSNIALSRGAAQLASGSKLQFHQAFIEIADYAERLEDALAAANSLVTATNGALLRTIGDAKAGNRECDKAEETIERLGQLIDQCDNNLMAAKLSLPAHIHVQGLTGSIRKMRATLFAIYTDLGGADEWADREQP